MKPGSMIRIISLILLACAEGSYSVGTLAIDYQSSTWLCLVIEGLVLYTLIKYSRVSQSAFIKIAMIGFCLGSVAYGTFIVWLHNPSWVGVTFGVLPEPRAAAGIASLTTLVFAFTALFVENKYLPAEARANRSGSAEATV